MASNYQPPCARSLLALRLLLAPRLAAFNRILGLPRPAEWRIDPRGFVLRLRRSRRLRLHVENRATLRSYVSIRGANAAITGAI